MEGEPKFEEQKDTARKNVLEELDSVALEALLEQEPLTEDMMKTLKTHHNDFYELLRKEDWESLNSIFGELTELMGDHPRIVIRMGMVRSVLSLLTDDISIPSDTQRNAILMLINLMHRSTEHVISLVELGIIPILFRCLKRDDKKLGGLELWALINISEEDDPKYRTEILGLGILPWIQKKFEGNRTQSFSGTHIALLVRNLLRFPLIVPVDEVLVILPILMNWINTDDFLRTSENALWSLASLCETQDERILNEITNPTVVVKLVQILRVGGRGRGRGKREFNLIFLRLCDSLKGDKNLFLTVYQEDLETLKDLLHDKNELIRFKTCHLLSFLLHDLFGFRDEESVLVHEIMPRIIDIASDDGVETKEQATNCLFNFIQASRTFDRDKVQYLMSQGLLTILLANLADHNNNGLVNKSLETILEILRQELVLIRSLAKPKTKRSTYAVLIQKSHFGSLLKDLRNHKEAAIGDLASEILDAY